jgi:hypothetical protein
MRCADVCPGDDTVAVAEERSKMTRLRRWIANIVAAPEPFPVEFRAERLDQPFPLARSAGWHEAQQAGQVRYSLR